MDINVEEIREHLEKENLIRERLREETGNFEKTIRVLIAILNRVHSTSPTEGVAHERRQFDGLLKISAVTALLDSAKPLIKSCREHSAKIAECVPPHQFWRHAARYYQAGVRPSLTLLSIDGILLKMERYLD